jgi:hypothetical protein
MIVSAVPAEPDDPVGELVGEARDVGFDRPADIEAAAHLAEAAALDEDLAVPDELRHLRDEVDEAARAGLPVEDRGRPLDDVDPLQAVGIDAGEGVAV